MRRLAFQETHGYRLGSELARSDAVVARIRRETLDVPFEESWHRAVTISQPFTDRQREIISLAAHGLSKKEIADRLIMSIRSVEGHLFRACQRVGANSREQLISILRGD